MLPAEERGNDLIQIMHRIYRELLIDAQGDRSANRSASGWEQRHMSVGAFEGGINHGMMNVGAGFIHRVMRKCGKGQRRGGWAIIAHTHECELMQEPVKPGGIKHAHVCGFYAIRIEEGKPSQTRKLTFPFVSATDATWITNLALDIYELFALDDEAFVWN